MRLVIKSRDNNKNINIKLPMGIIIALLKLGEMTIKKEDDCNNNQHKVSDILRNNEKANITKGLKYLNKYHKGLTIIDIEDSNGDIVKIEI